MFNYWTLILLLLLSDAVVTSRVVPSQKAPPAIKEKIHQNINWIEATNGLAVNIYLQKVDYRLLPLESQERRAEAANYWIFSSLKDFHLHPFRLIGSFHCCSISTCWLDCKYNFAPGWPTPRPTRRPMKFLLHNFCYIIIHKILRPLLR